MFETIKQHRWYKPKIAFAITLFIAAFTLRAIFALQWQHTPYGDAPLLDAKSYDDWAQAIINGTAGSHVFYQSPLYPYMLSVLYRLTGHSYLAVSFLNVLLDSSTVVLIALSALEIFGPLAATIAGLMAVCYAPMIFYTAPPMKESLALFLIAIYFYTALRALKENNIEDYAFCGLAFGFAALTRGNILLLLPLLPIFAFMRFGRQAPLGVLLFLLTFTVPILPVFWHNGTVADADIVPITYSDGFNLYVGHSPYADGTNAYPPGISTGPDQEPIDVVWQAQQQSGAKLQPSEVSSFWRDKAFDYMLNNPAHEIDLLVLKFLAFWNGAETYDNYDPKFIKENFASILTQPLITFGIIAPLAVFAAFAAARRYVQDARISYSFAVACLVVYMGSLLIFYVTDRYRLPAVIFLLPFAGGAIPSAAKLIIHGRRKQLLVASIAGMAFLGLAQYGQHKVADLSAFDWGVLTTVYTDKQDDDAALDAFQKGLALSSETMGSQAFIRAAAIYERRGQLDTAENLIAKTAHQFPKDGVVLYNLGRMQALRGRLSEAVASMEKARDLNPTYCLTYFALARIYDKQGEEDAALQALHDGLAINPDDPHLLSLASEWQGKHS